MLESVQRFIAALGAFVGTVLGYRGQSAYQTGLYTNAALGPNWVSLTSVDFVSMGEADPVTGPQACEANLDFAEVSIWNDSAVTVYFILRPPFIAPGPLPEDPAFTGFPVTPGGVVTKEISLIDGGGGGGGAVYTISIIAGAAASAVRVNANFAQRT